MAHIIILPGFGLAGVLEDGCGNGFPPWSRHHIKCFFGQDKKSIWCPHLYIDGPKLCFTLHSGKKVSSVTSDTTIVFVQGCVGGGLEPVGIRSPSQSLHLSM